VTSTCLLGSLQDTVDHDLAQTQIVAWIAQLCQLLMGESSCLDLIVLGKEFEQSLVFEISFPAEIVNQIVSDCVVDS
jgi:hypothetical protein